MVSAKCQQRVISRAADIFDQLLAGAFTHSSCLSHVPLLSGYDEPRTLSYQITLFGPIGADEKTMLQQDASPQVQRFSATVCVKSAVYTSLIFQR